MKTTKKKTTKKKTVTNKKVTNKKKTSTKKKLSHKQIVEKIELRRKRIRKSLILLILLLIMFICSVIVYYECFTIPTLSIKNTYVEGNQAIIKYKRSNLNFRSKVYCLYTTSDEEPSIDDYRWFLTFGNTCTYL